MSSSTTRWCSRHATAVLSNCRPTNQCAAPRQPTNDRPDQQCSVDGVMGPSYGPSLRGRQDSKYFGTGLPIIPWSVVACSINNIYWLSSSSASGAWIWTHEEWNGMRAASSRDSVWQEPGNYEEFLVRVACAQLIECFVMIRKQPGASSTSCTSPPPSQQWPGKCHKEDPYLQCHHAAISVAIILKIMTYLISKNVMQPYKHLWMTCFVDFVFITTTIL